MLNFEQLRYRLIPYMRLIPGVMDMAARDVTRNQGTMGGLTCNGAGSGQSTFSLDGVTANDTGSNNREPASRRSINSPDRPRLRLSETGPSPIRRDPDG